MVTPVKGKNLKEDRMNSFTYRYPVTAYFGEKAAGNNLPAQLKGSAKM